MLISIIAAISKNNVIGNKGQLPWHLADDLKNFKKLTLNKPIIMGRKTFASIGKALPQRFNIIISRDKNYTAPNIMTAQNLNTAILIAQQYNCEIFIIGGAQIYQQALVVADKLYLTVVDAEITGDTFFPEWNQQEWELIRQSNFAKNIKNDYDFIIKELVKKSPQQI